MKKFFTINVTVAMRRVIACLLLVSFLLVESTSAE